MGSRYSRGSKGQRIGVGPVVPDGSGNDTVYGSFPQCCAGDGIYSWCCQGGIYKYRQDTGGTFR